MKLKNILVSILVMLSILFIPNVKADTAPSTLTINASDMYMLYGSDYLGNGSTLKFTYKKTTTGQIVYCTEIHDTMVSSGSETYTLSKVYDAKIAYVLANGYPTKSITGDNNKDYYITGLAIWYLINPNDSTFTYFNLSAGTYKGVSSDIVKEINRLVTGAKEYSYVDPAIKINNSNSSLTLSSDKKYYVSSKLSVTTTGNVGDYTVSLSNAPEGTIVTDVNGNVKNTFGGTESFIVKVPASSINKLSYEFGVSVSATGTVYKAYLYVPSVASHQSLTTLYKESKDVNDSTTLKLNLMTEVQISKVDATTGEELPGATLVVKDEAGKVVDEWVSTNEVHVIKGLKPGKYTLTETIAPEGYKLSSETIEFTIKEDGSVTKAEMKNYLEDKPVPISISKQDITTGEELPGAHLVIKNEDGEIIYAWVSGETPFVIEDGLKPGKYTLTETIAPEGYELSEETVEFTVKEDGSVDGMVIMYNKPETVVEVPSTSSFKTMTGSLIGIVIIGLGALIIYKNYKKNEEK